MPRMSDAEKQKSYKRILESASQLFRERGIETTSVSDVMKTAGLTHGGFYRHFDSKQALVAAAFKEAVDHVLASIETASPGPHRKAAQADYVARYLSQEHVGDRSTGCPLAALGPEMARKDGPESEAAWDAVQRMARALESDDPNNEDDGIAKMALLLGTITLARLANSDETAAKILATGQKAERLLEQGRPT